MVRSKTSLYGRRAGAVDSISSGERGFTLIELVVVVTLIAIISAFTVTRISSIALWQHESDIRRFTSLWQSLEQEAANRQETYRLTLNFDSNSYNVRREVPIEKGDVVQVDYLKNLRTKREKERRKREEEEQALASIDEEFQREDLRQSGSLESLYYNTVFQDSEADVRLTVPLQAPSLAEEKPLAQGLFFRDVEYAEEVVNQGSVYLKFVPHRFPSPAIVHLVSGENVYSLFADPVTGRVMTQTGDLRFRDVFGTKR